MGIIMSDIKYTPSGKKVRIVGKLIQLILLYKKFMSRTIRVMNCLLAKNFI